MRKSGNSRTATKTRPAPGRSGSSAGRIHPVVIYPIRPARDYADLQALYQLVRYLDADKRRYARPLTVLDRKTHYALRGDKEYLDFRRLVVSRSSEVLDVWAVDTCQMWYAGLGAAFERGAEHDVYWLIPGDFNYGTKMGHQVLGRLHDLPEIVRELNQDLCIGEITADYTNSKQLIDTYGTFALLYNWFPDEAREIRQYTERPRSEFFAVRHDFLGKALCQRWYPYEQTMVMLLQAVRGHRGISRFSVGNITDLPEGKESLAAAMQQVERTERVLKSVWREYHQGDPDWIERYRQLVGTSTQVRYTAISILRNLLEE